MATTLSGEATPSRSSAYGRTSLSSLFQTGCSLESISPLLSYPQKRVGNMRAFSYFSPLQISTIPRKRGLEHILLRIDGTD